MKKVLTILLLIIMCLSLMSCKADDNKSSSKQAMADEPNIENMMLETNSTDLKIISQQLMEKFFSEYKKQTVNKDRRIEDYKIVDITNIQGTTDKFHFDIDYSLKPSDIKSYCLAGNGKLDGLWIVHKFAFVEVENSKNGYKIISMATGR